MLSSIILFPLLAYINLYVMICMQIPTTEEDWQQIASDFQLKWNFPNCIGAIDGKHILIQKPQKSGSVFRNYKQAFSIVLMAVVDANYRFIYVDVGADGRVGDAGVYNNCKLSRAFERNTLHIPADSCIGDNDLCLPFCLVGDEAFPLKPYLMKPFHRRGLINKEIIFNYRLSRARRVVENAFGILANRFRVFKQPISLKVSTTKTMVLATVCLHNFLRSKSLDSDEEFDSVDHEDTISGTITPAIWRNCENASGLQPLGRTPPSGISSKAKAVREALADYFMTTGSVPWQWRLLNTYSRPE
jgi:hypothetical protein